MYIYTNHQTVNTMDIVVNAIRSFFSALLPLPVSLPEHIRLVNVQLIPRITYRLMAHPLIISQHSTIHNLIWKHIRKPRDSAPFTPKLRPKVRFAPRSMGGLASRHFFYSILQDTGNSAIRSLNGDGPPHVWESVRALLLSRSCSSLQDTVVDAAQSLGLRFNTLGPSNTALPKHLLPGEPVWVRLDGAPSDGKPVYEGVVKETSATTQKRFSVGPKVQEYTLEGRGVVRGRVKKGGGTQEPGGSQEGRFVKFWVRGEYRGMEHILGRLSQRHAPLHLPKRLCIPIPLTPHALNQGDLLACGCDDADTLRQRATAATVWVYLDGLARRGRYGLAATIYLPDTLCLPSPFHSSGGAKFGGSNHVPSLGTRLPPPLRNFCPR